MSSPISNLSTELLIKIFTYVDINERLKLEEVCKRWCEISKCKWLDIKYVHLSYKRNSSYIRRVTNRLNVLEIYDTCNSPLLKNITQYIGVFNNLQKFEYSTVEHSCDNFFCNDTNDLTQVLELLPVTLKKFCLHKCILLPTYNIGKFKSLKHFSYSYPNCLSYELENVLTNVLESLPDTLESLHVFGQSLNTKFHIGKLQSLKFLWLWSLKLKKNNITGLECLDKNLEHVRLWGREIDSDYLKQVQQLHCVKMFTHTQEEQLLA